MIRDVAVLMTRCTPFIHSFTRPFTVAAAAQSIDEFCQSQCSAAAAGDVA